MNRKLVICLGVLAACSDKAPVDDSFTDLAGIDEKADSFTGRMTVVGSIEYGQTKGPFNHAARKWSALSFSGSVGDQITVDVKSSNGDTVAWVLDAGMNILGYNDDYGTGTNSHIALTLPANASLKHYIVVRDYDLAAMRFTVSFKGKRKNLVSPCSKDADCALVRPDCCSLQNPIGVRADMVDTYRASLGCVEPLICPAVAVRDNHAMAECISNKCQAVLPENISCGGFTINPHSCPEGYNCVGDGLARDLPGTCEPAPTETQCGGIRGLTCAGDQICVDDPTDSCDPRNGGADCIGVCKDSICSGATARCAAGYHWDQFQCNCVENSFCGGIAGFPCPSGKTCVDNPDDSCDPNNGGADCGGICVSSPPVTDCRTTGCGTGRWCSFCWGSFQCIPDGALC